MDAAGFAAPGANERIAPAVELDAYGIGGIFPIAAS